MLREEVSRGGCSGDDLYVEQFIMREVNFHEGAARFSSII